MSVTVTVDGADELVRELGRLEIRLRREVSDLITRYTKRIAEDARRRAPKGATGELEKSIKAVLDKVARELYGDVEVGAFYGIFLEVGTTQAPPHPFLQPAFEAHAPAFLRDLKAILDGR